MRNDPHGTGAVPSLTSAEILEATRGIETVTGVETEDWGNFPGPHMTVERMWALRNRIAEHVLRPEVLTFRCETVTVSAADVAGYADGEFVAQLPVTCAAVRDAVLVLAPE